MCGSSYLDTFPVSAGNGAVNDGIGYGEHMGQLCPFKVVGRGGSQIMEAMRLGVVCYITR